MVGVAITVSLAKRFGKKTTFIMVNATLVVLSVAFFFILCTSTGFWLMLVFQVLISILTGVMSPLIWSMYADVSDYAEGRFHTASTGLIFSSSSMAQKFGSAIVVVRFYPLTTKRMAEITTNLKSQRKTE